MADAKYSMFYPLLSSWGDLICDLKLVLIVMPGPIVHGFPTRYTILVYIVDTYAMEIAMFNACPKQLCFL